MEQRDTRHLGTEGSEPFLERKGSHGPLLKDLLHTPHWCADPAPLPCTFLHSEARTIKKGELGLERLSTEMLVLDPE